MKLFQRLLVAPAALGLLSPLAANATEVNLNDIANYSDVETIELANAFDNEDLTKSPLLAGGEGLVDGPDGSFSETTTASFSVKMAIGAVDGLDATTALPDGNQTVQFQYAFDTKIKTSFTGDDSLEVAIDSGSTTAGPVDEFGLNNTSDALKVDGVAYKFPLGDSITAMVADNKDASSLFTVACAYGGPSDTLDDCGNVNAVVDEGGFMTGAEFDFGNGLTAAVGYAGDETDIMTKEGQDGYGANLAYASDNYGVSVTYGIVESGSNENTYTALNGYYSFDNGLNISAGYELGDIGGAAATADESTNYFVGVNGEVGAGELGAAIGTSGGQIEGEEEELMYEAYYSYPINDSMTITPLVFIKEKAATTTPDQTGVMVLTSFKF
jgi:hypothetical protein